MPENVLRLLPAPDPGRREPRRRPCRERGCAAAADGSLGFCLDCERGYRTQLARRRRLVDALCAALAALGNPLYAALGGGRRDLGAHVLAHLEELGQPELHVPAAAIEDFVAELDARAQEAS